MTDVDKYQIRDYVNESDAEAIEKITRETKFFTEEETLIARELVEERLVKGIKSGYLFNIMESENEIVAYSCFGEIPCSYISYDLYWIVVRNDLRGNGIGAYLLKKSEEYIKKLGGYQVYLDTSSKDQYLPTRNFYKKNGYQEAAIFKDFYDFKDDKIIFNKIL